MSITSVARAPRRIRRLAQIVQVLARNGFGYLVHRLNLQSHLPLSRRVKDIQQELPAETETIPKRFVRVLEELGPTFVKLGQILSTRPDIVPSDFIEALRDLQSHVRPFPTDQARRIIEQDLGQPVDDLFSHFEEKPFASGSIAQVYYATTREGKDVVVKVKRPGIDRTILGDLELLQLFAERMARIPEFAPFRPKMIVDELRRTLKNELDFMCEAAYTQRFHECFKDDERYVIPRVLWNYCASRVLTLGRVHGIPLTDLDKVRASGADCKALARQLADCFVSQFFINGFFHADPHPGNLFYCQGGRLGVVDFGMVGHLSPEHRTKLATTLIAVSRREVDIIIEVYEDLGAITSRTNREALATEIIQVLDKYFGMPLDRMDVRSIYEDITRIAREHSLVLPRELVLMGKALITVSSLARDLDPEFEIASAIQPYAKRLIIDKLMPHSILRAVLVHLWRIGNVLGRGPSDVRQLIRKVLGGELEVVFRHEGLDSLITELDRSSNRIAFSVLVAAIIIGSSLILHAKLGPMIFVNVSILGVIGYAFAFIFAIILVFAILRSGRL